MARGRRARHRPGLGRHALLPVSYTHLDVYKRQVLADPAAPEAVAGEVGQWVSTQPVSYTHLKPGFFV